MFMKVFEFQKYFVSFIKQKTFQDIFIIKYYILLYSLSQQFYFHFNGFCFI